MFQNGVDKNDDNDPALVTPTTPIKKVRRQFETFYWRAHLGDHDDPNYKSQQCYKINYRVEQGASSSVPSTKKDNEHSSSSSSPLPRLLLIHGFGSNLGQFRHQYQDLTRAGYCVYALDLLGFGASDKPDLKDPTIGTEGGVLGFSIELFGELVHDFILEMDKQESASTTTTSIDNDINKKQKWVLIGNSMGALCSLQGAQRLKDRVCGVILLNCAPGMSLFRYEDVPWPVRPLLWFFQKVMLGPYLGGWFFSNFNTRQTVETILSTMGVYRDTSNVDEELFELLLAPGQDPGSESVFLQVFGGDPGPTPESLLSNLDEDCPVLGIWGGADPWLSPDKGKHPATQFYKYMKNPKQFELQILDNVGHCPQDEAPRDVNQRLIRWLRNLPVGEE